MRTIPLTARQPRPFTPPALAARYEAAMVEWNPLENPATPQPQRPVFMLAVPTLVEKETIGSLMFELGVVQISRETVRNATLEAAFTLYGDEKGEELGTFLEGFWQQQEIYEDNFEFWREQERQRTIDEFNGGKPREPYPQPEQLTSLRDRMRAKREVDEIIERSPAVRRLLAAQTRYNQINTVMLVRSHTRGWTGLETQREAIGAPADGGWPATDLLTEECVDQLREEIGAQAWGELWREIDSSYGLSKEEVGNSDSPPASMSPQSGSTLADAAETGSGDSLGTAEEARSSSEPTPEPESGQTTEPPSPSGGVEKT